MKGDIRDDHIPVNKFSLMVVGMPALTVTELSGIEIELQTTTLPDRTVRSGGNTLPVEFTAKMVLHHLEQSVAMNLWFEQAKSSLPGYLRTATLIAFSASGSILRSWAITNMFPSKDAVPDFDMNNEGEYAGDTWTFKADDVLPI